jgi:hypothetical protein
MNACKILVLVVLTTCVSMTAVSVQAEMKVYDVDIQYREELMEILQRLYFYPEDGEERRRRATVEMLPTGQVLIDASAQTHQEIAGVLKAIEAAKPAGSPTLTLRYWVLSGRPNEPDAADGGLRMLGPVLKQLEEVHGELGFSVDASLGLTGESGIQTEAGGKPLFVQQLAITDGSTMNLKLELGHENNQMQQGVATSLTMQQGEYVVLGERSEAVDGKPGMLFYVVHWPRK